MEYQEKNDFQIQIDDNHQLQKSIFIFQSQDVIKVATSIDQSQQKQKESINKQHEKNKNKKIQSINGQFEEFGEIPENVKEPFDDMNVNGQKQMHQNDKQNKSRHFAKLLEKQNAQGCNKRNQREECRKKNEQRLIRDRVILILGRIKKVRVDICQLNMEKSFDKFDQIRNARELKRKCKQASAEQQILERARNERKIKQQERKQQLSKRLDQLLHQLQQQQKKNNQLQRFYRNVRKNQYEIIEEQQYDEDTENYKQTLTQIID